ncbi:MAG: hypothetical protein ACM309_12585 [Bacillota bacterium]
MTGKEKESRKKRGNNGRIPRRTPWSIEEVRGMPNDKILAALHGLGISISMDDLREQVKEFCSAEDLSERWFETYHVTATGWDEDFPWYAAWVLWERLDGDTIPYESINDLMGEGFPFGVGEDGEGVLLVDVPGFSDEDYDDSVFEDEDGSDEDYEDEYEDPDENDEDEDEDEDECGEDDLPGDLGFVGSSADISVCWMQLRAWDYIKALFSGKATSIEEAMEICPTASSLGEWCLDFADTLGSEAASSPVLARERLRFAREFCEVFPESDEEYIQAMRWAEAETLFLLDRVAEGDEVYRTVAQQWPDSTWAFIHWGDAYADKAEGCLEYAARAREIFNAALQRADAEEAEIIRDRLKDLGGA